MNKENWVRVKQKGLVVFLLTYAPLNGVLGCLMGMAFLYLYEWFRLSTPPPISVFYIDNWAWIPILFFLGVIYAFFSWFELKKKYGSNETD